MGTLDSRIAIVTGAGGGVGRGIATALAREGASVAIVDINFEGAKETAAQLVALGAEALAIECDIRESSQVDAAVASVVERFGGVNILVNNANAGRSQVPFEEKKPAEKKRRKSKALRSTGA